LTLLDALSFRDEEPGQPRGPLGAYFDFVGLDRSIAHDLVAAVRRGAGAPPPGASNQSGYDDNRDQNLAGIGFSAHGITSCSGINGLTEVRPARAPARDRPPLPDTPGAPVRVALRTAPSLRYSPLARETSARRR